MQLPDSVQNILAYGQGYKDGMKDGHICGFHDMLVCAVHDMTGILKKYHDMELEYAGLQEKARRERMENMPKFENQTEQKHGRWIETTIRSECALVCSICGQQSQTIIETAYCAACGAKMDGGDDNG